MPGQAENLVAKMQDPDAVEGDVDFQNDWKVVTLFIGGNDLCRTCQNQVFFILFLTIKYNTLHLPLQPLLH